MSSSVILFNKHLLDYANFRKWDSPSTFGINADKLIYHQVSVCLTLSFLSVRVLTFLPLAIVLTTWHLSFATIMTQLLARTTNLLDGRKTVKMTGRVYFRAIFPIGVFFSLSLICGNVTYLYLSVAFIQMLKVRWGFEIDCG